MLPSNHPVHQTVTRHIPDSEGGGWESVCVDCSYRVRYTRDGSSTSQLVHIISAGDLTARHVSHQITIQMRPDGIDISQVSGPADGIPGDDLNPGDGIIPLEELPPETWLTPEISAFLEQILTRLDG